jgi:hypothetical protein
MPRLLIDQLLLQSTRWAIQMCHGQGHTVIIHKEILNNTIYKEKLKN